MRRRDARIGMQVIYIPNNLDKEDIDNPWVEHGFIVEMRILTAIVRFFRNHTSTELRTKANGESVFYKNLIEMPAKYQRAEQIINHYLRYTKIENIYRKT